MRTVTQISWTWKITTVAGPIFIHGTVDEACKAAGQYGPESVQPATDSERLQHGSHGGWDMPALFTGLFAKLEEISKANAAPCPALDNERTSLCLTIE
jgi:hypothetical protein